MAGTPADPYLDRVSPGPQEAFMKHLVCAAVFSIAASGCAAINEADCHTDMYQVGMRDGRLGAGSQIDRYAGRCAASGGGTDASRYADGYAAGFAQRPIPLW
jgi:hypothetical protein